VPLESCLPQIRALHDLPAFFAVLGYDPLWQELPDGALVARAGDFLWFGCTLGPGSPPAAARAARLGRGGRIAGVAGLEAGGRALHLAIGFHGNPACRIALDAAGPLDLARLERLRPVADDPALATAARVAEALATEEAGDRFFRQFREALALVRAAIPGAIPPAGRHALALLHLTRVLVLYFVQAKGWLNGEPRFLRRAVDDCLGRGRSIHRDLLRPLFFGALNRPAGTRGGAVNRLGRIPFLNGGLFEPHALEQRWPADLPSATWIQVFDDLFERFHFVLAGADGPGIAPDMLGRVFEGVMDPEDRLASGSYYTPAALVDEVMTAALGAWLGTRLRLGASAADRELADPSPRARALLDAVTILDPAVGSGAFLLGALRQLSAPWAGSPRALAERKRAIVARNLFGVDRNANAVRLAELRLWLEVIAADPADDPERVSPLPNLDALLRQGDSLADPILTPVFISPRTSDQLATIRRQFSTATGTEKRRLARRLRVAEREQFRSTLARQIDLAEWRIRDLLEAGRGAELFEERRGLDGREQRELAALRTRRAWLRGQMRRTVHEESLPWFHYQSHFADVFAGGGGFDLVVGNPPWIRSERLAPEERSALATRYRWMRPGRTGRGYAALPDVAVAFLERGLELAAPGGIVAMLVPAKLASARYAAGAREALSTTTRLHVVADLSATHAGAFDATVYPLALVLSKEPASGTAPVRSQLRGGTTTAQRALQGNAPWVIVADPVREALSRAAAGHPTLGEHFPCHLGVKTGCNRVFLAPPPGIEPGMIRLALRGREVRPFRARPAARMLWTHDDSGAPARQLPPVARAWIEKHRTELLGRRDYAGGPAWSLFRTGPATAAHRVVWADLARELAAAALVGSAAGTIIPLNSCYVLPAPDEGMALRLTAWLNSTWLRALARSRAVPAASGFARFNAGVVGGLPCPREVGGDSALLELGRRATTLSEVDPSLQEELDDLAATCLDLGPSDRRALAGLVGERTGAGR
jgi:hypothetical protein